ncbi:hypothetical protein BU16DRAFT_567092 [Lophium mytilinum]|uniref:Uncharacterized protein n=1 Tax=Lophium mytilinum TaxID=390894 RepID=A0A6A6QC77_9PEZI|nr:hypothetical protein BU16DRAFT_567092 [Lophium mytilinum]
MAGPVTPATPSAHQASQPYHDAPLCRSPISVVPPGAVKMWVEQASKILPADCEIKEYSNTDATTWTPSDSMFDGSEESCKIVLISSWTVLQTRHSYIAWKNDMCGKLWPQWRHNLTDCYFYIKFFDEAHRLKDPKGITNDVDPFDYADDEPEPDAICNESAIVNYPSGGKKGAAAVQEKSDRLFRVFKKMLLARSFASVVVVKAEGNAEAKLHEYMDQPKEELFSFKVYKRRGRNSDYASEEPALTFSPPSIRSVNQGSFFFPLFHLPSVNGTKAIATLRAEMRKSGMLGTRRLRHVMKFIFDAIKKDAPRGRPATAVALTTLAMGFNPRNLSDADLLKEVVDQSPKLKQLAFELGIKTVVER